MSRQPLVLVPGLLCDEALYEPQQALADIADITVADVTAPPSIAAMAEAVLAVAPEEFALLGLSMGGYVAFEVLRQVPGRVRRLALLDTAARPDTAEQSARRRQLIELAGREGIRAPLDALWPREVAPSRITDAELRQRIEAMGERLGVGVFVRQQEAIVARADSRHDLAGIGCPTLVLCGREDAICPLDAHEEMAAGIPGADLEVIDDCGHLSTLERPEQVNEALRRWLGGASG